MGVKVSLREKTITGGRKSLYLDFYPAIPHPKTGKLSRREFLGMYIVTKPKNPIEKNGNKESRLIAEQIRQKRENELNKPEIYAAFEKEQLRIKALGDTDFIKYFKRLASKRKGSNYNTWLAAIQYLVDFTKGELLFSDLSESFCEDYKAYLLNANSRQRSSTKLSQNTAQSYFSKFKATLKQGYKDGILQNDINARVKAIPEAETKREFLTLEELNTLAHTECVNPDLKKAALFSALTGLRFSDIEKLKWAEVNKEVEQGCYIQFQQKKTGGMEWQPISEQAYTLLGGMGEPESKVFQKLRYSAHDNKHLSKWIKDAGISKKITFHCFRHTFAVLQLASDTDIYTVSKMLGHKELKTTQIYAKIVDKTKRVAADKIKLDL